MKVFSAFIQSKIRVILILTTLVGVFFSAHFVIDSFFRPQSEDLRNSLGMINRAISHLHDYKEEHSDTALIQAIEDMEVILTSLPLPLPDEAGKELLRYCTNLISDDDIDDLISILGDMARSVSSRFYTIQTYFSRIMSALVVATLVSFAWLVWVILYSFRQNSQFLIRSDQLLDIFKKTIDFESRDVTFQPQWKEEHDLLEKVKSLSRELEQDRILPESMTSGTLEVFIPRFGEIIQKKMACHRVAFAFMDENGNITAESASLSYGEPQLIPGFVEHLSSTSLGKVIADRKVRIINDLKAHYQKGSRSESTKLLLDEGIQSSLTAPIFIKNRCVGFLFVSAQVSDAYTLQDARWLEKNVALLKQAILHHYVTQQVIAETASAFVDLMERKDNETSLHIVRMSLYSHLIAKKLSRSHAELTPKILREILWFAPLHDIGKISIPDQILLKKTNLTDEERRAMQEHVEIGTEIIQKMDNRVSGILSENLLTTALDIISGHHERMDGSGYPRGLKGDEIPLLGRIVAVADVFDALTSKRPYKEAYSVEKAVSIMRTEMRNHFDPVVFDAFCEAKEEVLAIYEEYKEV